MISLLLTQRYHIAYESHGPLLMPLFILEFDIINPTFVVDKRAAQTLSLH